MVAVEGATPDFDKLFDYAVPMPMIGKLTPGMRVIVPFGKVSAKRTGIVFEVAADSDFAKHSKVKPITHLLDDMVLSSEALRLCTFLKSRTLCTYYDAARLMLPISAGHKISAAADTFVRLAVPYDEIVNNGKLRLTEKQSAVVGLLSDIGSASKKELCYLCGVTTGVITALNTKGVVEFFKVERWRTPHAAYKNVGDVPDFTLSREQHDAFVGLHELTKSEKPEAALLFGHLKSNIYGKASNNASTRNCTHPPNCIRTNREIRRHRRRNTQPNESKKPL
jgi:primosomal protein N'